MRRCKELVCDMVAAGDVAIPTANAALSSKRVLTMTYEEGLSVGDVHEVLKLDRSSGTISSSGSEKSSIMKKEYDGKELPASLPYEASDVAYLVSKTFCEQM